MFAGFLPTPLQIVFITLLAIGDNDTSTHNLNKYMDKKTHSSWKYTINNSPAVLYNMLCNTNKPTYTLELFNKNQGEVRMVQGTWVAIEM